MAQEPQAAASAALWALAVVAAALLGATYVTAWGRAHKHYYYIKRGVCVGDSGAGGHAVKVSEVSSHELRGFSAKREELVVSPVVRSVDIQPAVATTTAVAPMRTRALQLPSKQTVATIAMASSMNGDSASTFQQDHRVEAPLDASRCSPDDRLLGTQSSLTSSHVTFGGSSMRVRWRMSSWMLLIACFVAMCGHATSVSAAVEGASGYIVLVSIPVMDKVLPLKNLAHELLHRGYRVGFALPENCRHWVSDLDQLEFISLGNIIGKSSRSEVQYELSSAGVYDNYAATLRYYASFQRPMYSTLIEDFEDDRPNLVIVDRTTFAGFDACQTLNIPYVVNSPSMLLDIDSPPAHTPAPFSNFSMHTCSVLERCKNSLHRLRFRLMMVNLFKEVNQARRDVGLNPVTGKEDLHGHQLVLVNSMFGMDEARPIAPQFQMVGMLDRVHHGDIEKKSLSPDFEKWIASDRDVGKPLVFISFHSDVPLSPDFVAVIMDGLENIGARIIWRITLEEQAAFDLRSRARSSVFFLGDDDVSVDESLVLQLAPVSLLITAGDHFSVQQAFSLGVPVLGLPFRAEQWETMNMVVRNGAGLQLMPAALNQESVRDAARTLLQKPQYAEAAFRMGELLKTGGGTKRAADHIESMLEFGSAHLLTARVDQPLYKSYLVDVYLVYSVILFAAAIILRTCFAVVYSILQIAPEVHLGVTLDDDVDDAQANGHQEVNKPHPHGHNHHGHGKEKDV